MHTTHPVESPDGRFVDFHRTVKNRGNPNQFFEVRRWRASKESRLCPPDGQNPIKSSESTSSARNTSKRDAVVLLSPAELYVRSMWIVRGGGGSCTNNIAINNQERPVTLEKQGK